MTNERENDPRGGQEQDVEQNGAELSDAQVESAAGGIIDGGCIPKMPGEPTVEEPFVIWPLL